MPGLLALAAAAAPAVAADRTIGITSFDRIRVQGPYVVMVTTGKGVSAKASGDRAATDRVALKVEGRMLVVSVDRNAWGGWQGNESGGAVVTLTTPVLQSAFLVGSGSLTVDKMVGPQITLAVDGAGQLLVAAVKTDRLDVLVSGSGHADVAGVTKDGSATVRGSAGLDASKLDASDLVVASQSSGAVVARAKRSARVISTGAGAVTVTGPMACTVRQIGAGPVKCGK